MNAITLWDPYGPLITCGKKQWETRSWRPKRAGDVIAIHSSLKSPADVRRMLEHEPFCNVMRWAVCNPGCIIGTAKIERIITTENWVREHCRSKMSNRHEEEYLFGDYGPNRFAWKLTDVQRLKTPIPATGRQGFWRVPIDLEDAIVNADTIPAEDCYKRWRLWQRERDRARYEAFKTGLTPTL